MKVLRREKRKNPESNRMQYAYLCEDEVWRHIHKLAEISAIEDRTIHEKVNIIRNRLQKNEMPNEHILAPLVPRGQRLNGDPIHASVLEINADWGDLSNDSRPNTVQMPGTFEI